MAARFTRGQYAPGLFDVTQDITGSLPSELIERWLESDQTHEDALVLLEPHRVTGYNMASDSAGLTRMTQRRGLMEIMALIHRPKEIVYRIGRALGGHGEGIWAADNTQTFFPEEVDAAAVLSAMLTIQDEVAARCAVRIGLGVHFGGYYSVAGGLYGEQAEAIEAFVEDSTAGGEVVISQAFADRLPPGHGFTLVARGGAGPILDAVYDVTDGPRMAEPPDLGGRYPIPFSEGFYRDVVALAACPDDEAFARAMSERYTHDKVVVLIEREPEPAESREVELLNNLALTSMLRDAGRRHLDEEHGDEIKVVGGVGIYTFDDPARAVEFAELFRRELGGDGIHCRIGVDLGPVLVFELAGGGKDIAGGPVNIASKLAQDRGQWGKLYLTDRVFERVDVRGFQPITYTVSGVDLHAFEG